jgi:hypothetical protein
VETVGTVQIVGIVEIVKITAENLNAESENTAASVAAAKEEEVAAIHETEEMGAHANSEKDYVSTVEKRGTSESTVLKQKAVVVAAAATANTCTREEVEEVAEIIENEVEGTDQTDACSTDATLGPADHAPTGATMAIIKDKAEVTIGRREGDTTTVRLLGQSEDHQHQDAAVKRAVGTNRTDYV